MSATDSRLPGGCPFAMGRRNFLAVAGASALTLKMGSMSFATSLLAEQNAAEKPRIRALFVRPEDKDYWMSWPGADFDPEACQAEYTKTMTQAAHELGLHLDVSPVPLNDPESIEQELQLLRRNPPAGLMVTVMHLESWPQVRYLLQQRGDLPSIVFSPLGTSLARQARTLRDATKTFVATTPDHTWLATGMRMLKTTWDMNHACICIFTDAARGERQAGKLGPTLRYLPLSRWIDEVQAAEDTDEMREIAKHYAIEAMDIVGPGMEDLLNAARNYVVARRILAAENCQGISVDCGPLIGNRQAACGPCLAWSKLLDEGWVGACEADADAAVSLLLAQRLFGRPGFMQDAVPNTVNNSLIVSHCTSATKLHGDGQPPAPYRLRSHAESDTGVAMEVLWPVGQEVTLVNFQRPDTLLFGTGQVRENVRAPFAGGCRTSLEIAMDGAQDVRDVKGHHQILVCGNFAQTLRAYCQLADLRAEPI